MGNTLPDIRLPADTWVNIYQANSISGTPQMVIQNIGQTRVRYHHGQNPPTSADGFLTREPNKPPIETQASPNGLWAYSESARGSINASSLVLLHEWTPNYSGAGYITTPNMPLTDNWVISGTFRPSESTEDNPNTAGSAILSSPDVGEQYSFRLIIRNDGVFELILESTDNVAVVLNDRFLTIRDYDFRIESTATDITPPITNIGNGSFEGQIQQWRNSERDYQLIVRSETLPTDTVVRDELGGQTGILTNFPASQRWVPVLGAGQGYISDLNNANYTHGVGFVTHSVNLATPVGNIVGSIPADLPTGSLFISAGIVLQSIVYVGGTYGCARASGTNPQIQAAFEYPNVFNIQRFDASTQAYCGDINRAGEGFDYILGVDFNTAPPSVILSSNNAFVNGSWLSTINTTIPIGSIVTASNGAQMRRSATAGNQLTSGSFDKVTGTDEQIQQGFQWPNHFTVTPPP